MVMSAATMRATPVRSRKRFEMKSGIVIASPHICEYFLRRWATIFQFRYVPIPSPIPIHASLKPATYIAPGSPIRSQPDMSDAWAESATTHLFILLPPR